MKITYHIDEIDDVAKKIIDTYSTSRRFVLQGAMGFGKTTLINSFCKYLNVIDKTSSPTYSLINEYHTNNGVKVFHTDWYRLKSVTEAIDAGVLDILEDKNAFCFIEWGEKFIELLPTDCLKIKITVDEDNTRTIEI